MLGNSWDSAYTTADKLGIKEDQLSFLREYGEFKPGIHWRSSPSNQVKPWCPEAIYNVKQCQKVINKYKFPKNQNKFAA